MPDFDYRAAWDEVARPAFLSLPANIRALYDRVCEEAKDCNQKPDCQLAWPTIKESIEHISDSLFSAFVNLDAEWLAQAAQVIYYFGHWAPGHTKISQKGNGGYWRFSNYADQVLRSKLGAQVSREGPIRGYGFTVHNGLLRLCYSGPDIWTGIELGLATQTTVDRAKSIGFPNVDDFQGEPGKHLVDVCWPTCGYMPQFRNLDRYMREPQQHP